MKIYIILALILVSCSKKYVLTNQDAMKDGHYSLYSLPGNDELESEDSNLKRVVIASFNDFNGNINVQYEPTNPEQSLIPVGGQDAILQYINILREKTSNNLIIIDAGNFSSQSDNDAVLAFYQKLRPSVVNLGFKEFSNELITRPKQIVNDSIKIPTLPRPRFLNSNILDLEGSGTISWPDIETSYVLEVDDIKIGVIGVLAPEHAKDIDVDKRRGLYINNKVQAILRESRRLKKQGANAILLLASGKLSCKSSTQKEFKYIEKSNFNVRDNLDCNDSAEIIDAIKRLPNSTVDAVFVSGNQSKIANYIFDTPVIQTYGEGKYFGLLELYFDSEDKKVVETKIHQPVKICHYFFKQSNDCFASDSTLNHSEVIPASFLGVNIITNEKIRPKDG